MANQRRIDPKANPELYSYGANNLNSREIFFERLKYDTYVFPNYLADNFVSTWTTERYYGIVNNRGNSVYPNLRRLKSLRYSSDESSTNYALNFVADAWHDFAKKARELASQNVIFKNSPWAKPEVVKAWQPVQNAYDTYMREEIYPVFYDNFIYSAGRNKKVKNINDFIKQFDEFMQDHMVRTGPVTLSGFIESVNAPMYSSGLVIEVASDEYDDDFTKAYKFGDRNFSFIASIAAQYGFSIDKNIPWRLVADLRNPAMLEYMLGVPIEGFDIPDNVEYECEPLIGDVELPPMAYGYSQIPGLQNIRRNVAFFVYEDDQGNKFNEPGYRRYKVYNDPSWEPIFDVRSQSKTFEALFGTDYEETWLEDMNLLQNYILFFYNYYVSLQPSVSDQTQVQFDSSCGPKTYTFTRQSLTPEQFAAMFGDRWKLKTYYIIRDKERMRNITLKRRMYEIQRVMNNYNLGLSIDTETAYNRALKVLQEDFIGPADRGPLTLDRVGDIINSK
jgi:hypothetical protein